MFCTLLRRTPRHLRRLFLAGCVLGLCAVPLHAGTGDGDLDGDVDVDDFAGLSFCLEGPEVFVDPTCDLYDLDHNGTVDLVDFATFQTNFHGTDGPRPGTLDVAWIHGSPNCSTDPNPPIQVHQYNDNTYILRQNKCTHFEAPFIYVLFGDEKVFVQDTGATSSASIFPIASTVLGLVSDYEALHNVGPLEITVSHSHSHSDHTAGDAQFLPLPQATVVGTSTAAVQSFFGITSWPDEFVTYDLGGRVLDIFAIPGHQSASIAVYDRQTDILLTGDTLYPGRLYIGAWTTYQNSVERMVDFSATANIEHILGTHIEMSDTPGVDYPIGSTYQPNEHVLQLDVGHLMELHTAIQAMGSSGSYEVHDSFIIFPF